MGQRHVSKLREVFIERVTQFPEWGIRLIRIEIGSKSIAVSCRCSPYVRVTDDHMGPFDCMYEVIMINLGHLSWMLPSIDAITSRPEFPYLIRCSNLGFDVMSKVYDV